MSKKTTNTSNAPAFIAYQVMDAENGKKSYWNRVGVAFAHQDSKGFNLQLNSVPLDGRVVLRPYEPSNGKSAD